jgi:hypothetical protein
MEHIITVTPAEAAQIVKKFKTVYLMRMGHTFNRLIELSKGETVELKYVQRGNKVIVSGTDLSEITELFC